MTFLLSLSVLTVTLASAAAAKACPDCAIGRQARSAVFYGEDFAANLTIALLPFVIIGAICMWAEARGRSSSSS
ncbi:MAG: hypothetical protein RL701_1134 [Pseudomonadota bacterium]